MLYSMNHFTATSVFSKCYADKCKLMKVIECMKKINVKVNPYLEFMNSILLTSRYNEMTKPFIGYGLMVEDENKYTIAIKNFLRPYANDPLFAKIEEMIPNGFAFSRPVELMLSLGDSDDFSEQYVLSELCIGYCGGRDTVDNLLKQLKAFWYKTGYSEFFESVKNVYDPVVKRVSHSLLAYPFVDIIEDEYGQSQNSYNYILSSLMKGNFGICFHNQDTGKSDLFSVFSTDDFSLSPAVLFHEYSHPFINPLTDKYYELAQRYIGSYEKLKYYKLPDYQSGYGDFKECINEHLVRAMSIHLLKKINQTELANKQLNNDLYCGYKFILQILECYDYYDVNRNKYNNFEKFYPELLNAFDIQYLGD